jgi:hypothetical protein
LLFGYFFVVIKIFVDEIGEEEKSKKVVCGPGV